MIEFNKYRLEDICSLITKGTTPSTLGESFVATGINFVKSESITDYKYLDSSIFDHITERTHVKMARSQLKQNDLLFSIAGAYLGKIGIVRDIDLPLNTNQAVGIVRLNENMADVDYTYYYFSQKAMNTYINKISSQSAQPNLNLELLGNLPIKLPDLPTQKKIADVLSCIDDKIALNNKTNAELENMAKTIYDYWFTQFDFPDKNGHPYKTSGGQMVYNETLKREIPAGWEVGKLGFYLENFGDGIHGTPEYDDSGEYYFINGNNLGNKLISYNSDTLKINDEEYKKIQRPLNENTIFLSINGTLGSISFYNGEKIAIGKSACFLNIKQKEVKSFIYQILCSEKFQKYMYTVASGSTIKNFAPKQAADFDIPIPPKNLLKQFNNTTYLYLENQIKNEKENKELTKLRDYLLPLLMNGQININ